MMKKLKIGMLAVFVSLGMTAIACTPQETAHVHKFTYVADETYHWQVCECGETTEKERHHGGTASCSHKAVCEVCGFEYGELLDHEYGEWQYEEGSSVHYHICEECGDREEKPHIFNQEVIRDEYLVYPKVTECGQSNFYYKSCICGAHSTNPEDIFEVPISHDYSIAEVIVEDGVEINLASPATCEEPATYYYVCSHNHHHVDEEHTFKYGEPKGHTYGKPIAEVKTFSSYNCEYYHCSECGKYFIDVGNDGEHVYQEIDYEDIYNNEKNQYHDETFGTKDNPYILSCKEDIFYLRDLVNKGTDLFEGKYLKLSNDIDFEFEEGEYFGAPIGYSDTNVFKGNFDGDDHKLIGLSIYGRSNDESVKLNGDNLGLFSRVSGATIKNLKLENVNIDSNSERCAGIACRVDNTLIENCVIISGNIKGTQNTGGIVGAIHSVAGETTIRNCINRANITSLNAEYACVGGILGSTLDANGGSQATILLENNKNYGNINADAATTLAYAGGIVGLTRKYHTTNPGSFIARDCINFGNVHAVKSAIGGIIGWARAGLFDNCLTYENSKITVAEDDATALIGTVPTDQKGFIAGASTSGAGVQFEECCLCDADGNKLEEKKYLNGSGTEEDPYVLSTLEELQTFRDDVNSGNNQSGIYFALGADIDLTNVTFGDCIGNNDEHPFSGTFDGASHKIVGFKKSGENAVALFSRVTNGTIKNLVLENVNVSATNQRAAGLVARADGATIINCHVSSGTISGKTQNGGIVAVALYNPTTISNCSNKATINSTSQYNGGIIGYVLSDTGNHGAKLYINDCVNEGDINGASNGNGGILGATAASSDKYTFEIKVVGCINKGNITGGQYSGGIAGLIRKANSESGIFNCTNYGNVTSTGKEGVGGIVSFARVYVDGCYCSPTVRLSLNGTTKVASEIDAVAGSKTGIGYICSVIQADSANSAGAAVTNCGLLEINS